MATTALALTGGLAAAPASAADKMSVGVSGYMQQWIGVAGVDGGADDGGVSQYSDSEIFFKGKLEADNGLTFSVKVEFEGNTHPDVVDESQATVSGSWGSITLGSEDHVASLMHYGNKDVGVGLNCGDASFIAGITSCAREGGLGMGTAGWLIGGDDHKISYVTPRMNGIQFGASYIPNTENEDKAGAPLNNDLDAWSVAMNAKHELGDANVAVSLGHYQASQTMDPVALMSGMNDAKIDVGTYTANNEAIAAYATALTDGSADLGAAASAAAAAEMSNAGAMDLMSGKADAETWTNFGLQVGVGSFSFDVAYATHDGGAYMAASMPIMVTEAGHTFDDDGDAATPAVAESADKDDPSNNTARTVLVKDMSQDYEVASFGVMYSDGPMAVSLSHMMAEADDGSEASATMLSGSYNLAPGIASRTSLIAGEQGGAEGTAFVTGITLSF